MRLGSLSRQSSWEQRFKELKAFKKRYGHCNVPSIYPPNPALGHWTRSVRKAKKHGTLTKERVRRFDDLGFCWVLEYSWDQRIKDLKAFKKKYGHCNVPSRYQPDLALGHWVYWVRRKKKHCKLTEKKVRCLDALGFVWVCKLSSLKQHIHDLKAFKKKHGHCDVPSQYSLNPALGRWVNYVRNAKSRGMLSEDKILILDALGFSWTINPHVIRVPWKQRIHDMKGFKKNYGHCNVPQQYQPNPHSVVG